MRKKLFFSNEYHERPFSSIVVPVARSHEWKHVKASRNARYAKLFDEGFVDSNSRASLEIDNRAPLYVDGRSFSSIGSASRKMLDALARIGPDFSQRLLAHLAFFPRDRRTFTMDTISKRKDCVKSHFQRVFSRRTIEFAPVRGIDIFPNFIFLLRSDERSVTRNINGARFAPFGISR